MSPHSRPALTWPLSNPSNSTAASIAMRATRLHGAPHWATKVLTLMKEYGSVPGSEFYGSARLVRVCIDLAQTPRPRNGARASTQTPSCALSGQWELIQFSKPFMRPNFWALLQAVGSVQIGPPIHTKLTCCVALLKRLNRQRPARQAHWRKARSAQNLVCLATLAARLHSRSVFGC